MNAARVQSKSRAAFSIIELLVAIVILLIITAVFGRFFQRSTQSWESGMRAVEMMISGRTAVSLIARDIESAIADPTLFELDGSDTPLFVSTGDTLTFISMQPRSPYSAQRVRYKLVGGSSEQGGRDLERAVRPLATEEWTESTVISDVIEMKFDPVITLEHELPSREIGIRLRLSSRYDDERSRDLEFVARAYPAHLHRYPDTAEE